MTDLIKIAEDFFKPVKQNDTIRVKHPNGYSGVLYGKKSMIIYRPDGTECLHTGFRNKDIKTETDLYEQLEDMPEFEDLLKAVIKETEDAK